MSTTSKRAVIYVRISLDRDNETSTTTQRELCESYCKSMGWSVVVVLEDVGRSAYKQWIKRPQFEKAIRMVETHAADVLVVFKLDRFMRNAMEFTTVWKRIEKVGGEFASVTERFDTTTAFGRLQLFTIASMAEIESETKSERMLPWHALRVANQLPPVGRAPFGYDRPSPNTLAINEAEAQFVRDAVGAVLDGESLAAIARKLIASGLAGPQTASGFRLLFKSPTIAGLVKCKSTGTLAPGNWEPLIDRATWEALCMVLADTTRRTSFSQGKRVNLLTGLMVCADCDRPVMTVNHQATGRARYSCPECKSSCFIDMADDFVSSTVVELLSDDAWAELRMRGQGFDPAVIAAMEAEAEALARMHAAGSITLAQFVVMNDGVKAKMLAATESAAVELPNIESLRTGWPKLDVDSRRLVLTAITERITMAPHANRTRMGTERITIEY